jgi:hypothetical protein
LLAPFAIYRYPALFIERGVHAVIETLQLAAAYLTHSALLRTHHAANLYDTQGMAR